MVNLQCRLPLSRWLVLLVIGTALPLFVVTIFTLFWLLNNYWADQDRGQTETTRGLALAVDAEIRSWKTALQVLAGSHALAQGRLADFYQEARAVAARHESWIALTDAAGQQQLNTFRPLGDPLPSGSASEWQQAVFRDRQAVVSDLIFGRILQRHIVVVSVPVARDSHVLYSLNMAVGPERLARLLQHQNLPPSSTAGITDRQHRLIAGSLDVEKRPGEGGQEWLREVAPTADSGLLTNRLHDGRESRTAFQRLTEAPWVLAVAVPVADLRAAWQWPLLAYLLLAGPAALGGVGLAVGLARRIAWRVTEAARSATAVVQGDVPTHRPSRISEVVQLQTALVEGAATVRMALHARQAAADALRQANEALEGRVAERTASLAKTMEAVEEANLRLEATNTELTQEVEERRRAEAALQDSEARFRALADATFEGIAMAAEGRYIDMNEQWCALLGYRREELLGRDITANIPAEDQARVLPDIRAGKDTHVEHVMVRKDGTRMLVEVRGRTIQYQNRPVRVAAIRDITARKQTEEALRLSEEKFARAFAANPAAITLTRLVDGQFLDVNDTYLNITGFRRDEVLGRTAAELGAWLSSDARIRFVEALRQRGAIRGWEERFCKKSGEEFEALLSADVITLRGEELILATYLDITDRTRQEETLRRYQLLADRARDIVLFVARDGRLLEGNHAAVLAYGYSTEELRTRHIQDLRAPETQALTAAQMAQAAAEGILFETVHRRCDGTMFPVEVSSCGTRLGGDEVLLSIIRDITDRKRAEQALQRANDELEQRVQARTAELSQAIQTLERQAEQLRALGAELSLTEQRERRRLAELLHDGLQQILVAARFRATMLGQSHDPQVREGGDEIVALLQEALAAARTLTGELSPPTLRRGDLQAALAWLSGWMQETHRLTVWLHTPATPLPALPEDVAGLLYQAVRELLFNTVKHAQVPAADVTLAQVGAAVQVTVADAGVGFDPSRLRGTGGTGGGFGLFSIRERLEVLGGRLDIASTPGQGSQFTLWAPLQSAGREFPGSTDAPVPLSPVPRVAPPAARRKLRILLVDDHAMVRKGFTRLLSFEPDLEVVGEAADGKAAVELAAELQPDVVTMDVSMPVLDGIEATRQIRARCPAIRVVGLSMFESTEQSRAMLEAGAEAYVTKGGPVEELLAAIRGKP